MPNPTPTHVVKHFDSRFVEDDLAVEGDRDAPGKRKASDHPDPVVYAVDVLFHPTMYLWAHSDVEAIDAAHKNLFAADRPPVLRPRPVRPGDDLEGATVDLFRVLHGDEWWFTYATGHAEAAEQFLSAAVGAGLAGTLVVTVERAS